MWEFYGHENCIRLQAWRRVGAQRRPPKVSDIGNVLLAQRACGLEIWLIRMKSQIRRDLDLQYAICFMLYQPCNRTSRICTNLEKNNRSTLLVRTPFIMSNDLGDLVLVVVVDLVIPEESLYLSVD